MGTYEVHLFKPPHLSFSLLLLVCDWNVVFLRIDAQKSSVYKCGSPPTPTAPPALPTLTEFSVPPWFPTTFPCCPAPTLSLALYLFGLKINTCKAICCSFCLIQIQLPCLFALLNKRSQPGSGGILL